MQNRNHSLRVSGSFKGKKRLHHGPVTHGPCKQKSRNQPGTWAETSASYRVPQLSIAMARDGATLALKEQWQGQGKRTHLSPPSKTGFQ